MDSGSRGPGRRCLRVGVAMVRRKAGTETNGTAQSRSLGEDLSKSQYRRYQTEYRKRNRPYFLEYARKWRAANREKFKRYQHTYREKDLDRARANATKYSRSKKGQERQRQWATKNREKLREYHRNRYRSDNGRQLAKQNEWSRKNREKNAEEMRAKARRYYARNIERMRQKGILSSGRRRARIRGAKGSHTEKQWIARIAYYGWRCFYCRIGLDRSTLTKDHRIALSVGGTDFASNLVPACGRCNSGKRSHRSYTPLRGT